MKKVFKTGFFYLVVFAMVLGNSVLSIDFSIPVAQANNNPVTICHATGGGTYNEIHVNENAINGHFQNNGTPKSGHEDDLLFEGNVSCPGPEPSCGDGTVNQTSEQCDGDAPKACTTEAGYAGTQTCNMSPELTIALVQTVVPTYCVWNDCVPTEYCGDGTQNGPEQCDDNNTTNGDGCSATCQTEEPTPACGDGKINQTSEQCDDGNTTTGDGCDAQCQTEEPENYTIKAAKVVCESEEYLPNWGNDDSNDPEEITATTAQDYIDGSDGKCWLEKDWAFQWGINVADPGNDFIGPAGSGWNNFDTTTGLATMAEASILYTDGSTLMFREVLPTGYLPFAWNQGDDSDSDGTDNNISAEIYCYNDIYNYDNYDWINNPEVGATYYCVAFNVDIQSDYTCGNEIVEGNEQCDDGVNGSATCTSDCTLVELYCGDGIVNQLSEQCDGDEPQACTTEGGYAGTQICNMPVPTVSVQTVVSTYCVWNECTSQEYCGDNIKNGLEECDGSVACAADCTLIDQPPVCYEEGESFFASTVESYDQGQRKDDSNVEDNRSVPEHGLALEPDPQDDVSHFFSLGFGGWTIVSFDEIFVDGPGNDIKITEDTWGAYPLEKADVYVSQDGTTWALLGTANNVDSIIGIHTTSEFDLATSGLTWGQYIKVVDTSDPSVHTALADGYDLNAVEALSGGYIGECKEFITVCKMDEQENPLSEWEMTLYGSNLIVNGGFETPILSSGTWAIYPDATLTSWTVNAGDGLEIQNNAAGAPHGGNQLAELDSNNSSVVSQIITTVPGEEYNFSFWYSPRPGIGSGDNTIGVSVQGIGDSGFLVSDTVGATAVGGSNTTWTLYQYSFTATQTSTEIKFVDLGTSNSLGGYLDDVVLQSVTSGLTGENGCVEFAAPYDVYQIMETMQNGWIQIEPVEPNYFTVDFNEENNYPTVTFVNRFDDETAYCGDGDVNQESEQCDGDAPQACTTEAGYAGTRACNMEPELTLALQTVEPTYCVWDECVTTQYCGDGTTNGNEQCDDGNVNSGDGCSATCTTESGPTPYCGDETVNQTSEQCDWDGPQACTTEAGYAGTQTCNMPSDSQSQEVTYCVWNQCITTEFCGDETQNGLEQCDDGNNSDGDGCSSTCYLEGEPPCTENCGGGGGGGGTTFAIKNLNPVVSCGEFELSWATTKSSDTILDFGTESGVYTEHINNATNSLNHSVQFDNLLPNTTYYYKITAIANSNGFEINIGEKSFTTPPAEQCGAVLGEKIEGIPLICDFIRPSGSHGPDKDITGVFQFPEGSLIRSACDSTMPVYLIKEQKKWHIPNWKYLHDHYFGQRIYNVLDEVVNNYLDWTPKVLGVKYYADGTLLRGANMKIYIIEGGKKRHITSLEELLKYAGQNIINVSDDVLNQY